MKFKFNENTILIILGVFTFLVGILTIKLPLTLLAMAIIVIIALLMSGTTLNDVFGKKTRKNVKNKMKNIKKQSSMFIKNGGKQKFRWFRLLGVIIITLFIIGLASGMILFAYVSATAPKFDPKELLTREQTILYDENGNTFATLGSEKREKIAYNELPQVLIDAIVATEDSRFFQHNGFDLPRFIKASIGQATGNSSAGGASTLDMQIAKNAFTSTNKSIIRKLTDIYLSVFKIERKYSKEEIFEFYVNTPFLGSNSYGVQQASRTYFGKNASELSLSEAAIIAGLFQSPSAYNPYSYPEKTAKRRSTVLYLMERHGYINESQRAMADAIPVKSLLAVDKKIENVKYQGYIDTVVEEVIKKTGSNPYNVSMKIYTNLDQKKQMHIDDIVNGKTYKWANNQVQAGATLVNTKTGAIQAVLAGRNRQGERSFNFATMLKRQPGSTAKPLFDYGPGIEYENWSTYTPFVDKPHSYSDGTSIKNWDSKYMGFLTLRRALMFSRNIPALKAFQANKNANVLEFVRKIGLHPEVDKNGFIHEAHAIGGYNGESPTSLVGAFASFGNNGYYIEPYTVNKIEYRDSGEVVNLKSEKTRAMSEATAFMINDVLVSTVNGGLSGRQRIPGIQVAAKTGTTNFDSITKKQFKLPSGAINDLWECAYTPDDAICIWYGYAKISNKAYNRSADGSKRSALLRQITGGVFDKTGNTWKMPDSVVKISIVNGSNPPVIATSGGVTELFKKGFEPKLTGKTQLSNVTNLNAFYNDSANRVELSWNHISDMAEILTTYENTPDIGDLGYEIFMDDGSGYKSIGFTEDNVFTKQLSGNYSSIKFMIKTTFSNNKAVASSGTTTTVEIGTLEEIKITLNGLKNVTLPLADANSWVDPKVKVTINGVDVTNSATISISSSPSPFDRTKANTYILSYTVNYNGKTYPNAATRTVVIS